MAAYATVSDVQNRILRKLSNDELDLCKQFLEDAAVLIDAFALSASADAKQVVSCRMVVRALGSGEDTGVPVGANQGTQSALGYSQTWIYASAGSSGELYLSKLEKQILRSGDNIGSYSPVQELAGKNWLGETI